MRHDSPLMLPIAKVTQENSSVKTFWFDFALQSHPGQFVMLWIPGVDQKPFSIAYDDGRRFGLSIFAVGPHSKKLFDHAVGERVGVTGPYGNPFSVQKNRHYITVAGGYGAGPLGFLAERLEETCSTVDFCIGARTSDLLLFEKLAKKLSHVTVHVATDDGSRGHHGYVTDIVRELLEKKNKQKKDTILSACGPELMEKAVLNLANEFNVDCDISIERYMKCGVGICGNCVVDDLGITTCQRGTVMDNATARKIKEFGVYHRDSVGRKVMY
ncbi:MAG TPA: dihydroorotate dehydrogenase electron transfer subunit [Candidatus Magasanikbacteria bacterium]|nr:dihydroorotate dehydrogenase electron transfer subunit [Candidatus Magasanikbacteria bacterium]